MTTRLNKFIADAGVCSRRKADELIAAGEITVNHYPVTELGYQVKPTDTIRYKGQVIAAPHAHVYILLNKPKGYVTTVADEDGRPTVMDLIADATKARVYPVGRLDYNTTGLLLLTNDGELAHKLMHPRGNVPKTYEVKLSKPLTETDFERLQKGVKLEDGFIKPDHVLYAPHKDQRSIIIEIHSGKNRIIRRLFEALGYLISKLNRINYAGLTQRDLAVGAWRHLTAKEVERLKK